MLKNLSRLILVSTTLCVLLIFSAAPVLACSPTEEAMNLTLADRVDNAPMIIVGTVTHGFVTTYGNGYEYISEVEVEVETYLKGEGPTIVRIDGFGQGSDCRSIAQIGHRSVFFVSGNPDETLDAVYLGIGDATWNATPETLTTITAITGENNAPYPLPIITQIMRFVNQYAMWILTLVLLFIAFTMTPIVMKRLRNPRKSKAKRS